MRSLWTAAGAQVVTMDADVHDHVFAAVSHLPHVAAYAMVCTVAEMNAGPESYISFTGAGFQGLYAHCGQLAGNVERHLSYEQRQPR